MLVKISVKGIKIQNIIFSSVGMPRIIVKIFDLITPGATNFLTI